MKRICVFCGSSSGRNPGIREEAAQLGRLLSHENIDLVYGGGSIGLMGVLADAVLEAGGRVIGVIPKALARKEITHNRVTEMYVVESMHERKATMAKLADGFIGLPGGLGTLEEFFEVLTWAQLGLHQKPIGLLNACGYYDSLLAFLQRATEENFIWNETRALWHVDTEPDRLLKKLLAHKPPEVEHWLRWNQE